MTVGHEDPEALSDWLIWLLSLSSPICAREKNLEISRVSAWSKSVQGSEPSIKYAMMTVKNGAEAWHRGYGAVRTWSTWCSMALMVSVNEAATYFRPCHAVLHTASHMTSLSLSILPSQIQILPFFCHFSAILLPFCHVHFIHLCLLFFPHFVSMSPETRSKLTRPNTTVENCQQWAVDNRCTAISCDIQGNHVGNHVVKHWSHSLLLFILRWLQGNLVISISPNTTIVVSSVDKCDSHHIVPYRTLWHIVAPSWCQRSSSVAGCVSTAVPGHSFERQVPPRTRESG